MEKLDKELQSRVWQRVQSRDKMEMPTLGQENLKPLILTAQENLTAYQQLGRQIQGKNGEKIGKLRQETNRAIACMKGICRLRGEPVKNPPLPAEKEPANRALMKCYRRERSLWSDWERLAGDPEYGPVYAGLCHQAREHCVTIMELLGSLDP